MTSKTIKVSEENYGWLIDIVTDLQKRKMSSIITNNSKHFKRI